VISLFEFSVRFYHRCARFVNLRMRSLSVSYLSPTLMGRYKMQAAGCGESYQDESAGILCAEEKCRLMCKVQGAG